jgi:toxin ParE1/3/4
VSHRILERPRAGSDIDQILDYFLDEYPPAAEKFLDALEAAYTLLSEHPLSGSTRHASIFPELSVALRFLPLQNFPRVLVYYLAHRDSVEVIRVWDAARGLEALVEDEPQE